jgi:hypothetical protein
MDTQSCVVEGEHRSWEEVSEIYLMKVKGVQMIKSPNDIETEIKSKTAVGNKCYYALGTILKRRSISQSIKFTFIKQL